MHRIYSRDKTIQQIVTLLGHGGNWRVRMPDITFTEHLILKKGTQEIHRDRESYPRAGEKEQGRGAIPCGRLGVSGRRGQGDPSAADCWCSSRTIART